MARKEENLTFQDKLKAWWETDTAKAVATIVAVLLIPASVIAWNYATTQGQDIRDDLGAAESTEATDTDEQAADMDNMEEADDADTMNIEPTPNDTTTSDNQPATDTTAQNTQGQEPAATTPDQNTNTDQPAVGGLGSVQKLPNTDSVEKYTVLKGDTVYSISMKVCGNNSFYLANANRDYLKVSQVLEVECN